jgi:hypothetical protein
MRLAKIGARCSEVFDAYYDPVVVNTQVAVLRDYACHSVCSGNKMSAPSASNSAAVCNGSLCRGDAATYQDQSEQPLPALPQPDRDDGWLGVPLRVRNRSDN